MQVKQDGIYCRSEVQTFALGQQLIIRPDFLSPALNMAAPEVAELEFVLTGTFGAVTGGAQGEDAAKMFENLRFIDDAEVFNISGACARVLEQMEFGSQQVDPADISSGATNTTYEYTLRVSFEPLRALRPRDTRIPLEHFMNGGQLIVTCASAVPTGFAAVQADQRVQVIARVVDGRTKEVKSRMEIREQVVSQQEFRYPIYGSLRSAFLTSKLTTTLHTSLASFTSLNSDTLEIPPNFDPRSMTSRYRRMGAFNVGTNDEFVAENAIPLIVPDRRQKVGAMPDLDVLHLNLGAAAPTGGRLVTTTIRDRTARLAALVAGFQNPSDYANALRKNGYVVDGSPHGSPVLNYHPTLVRRLPCRIRGMGA